MLKFKNHRPQPSPKTQKQIHGALGEDIAADFLVSKGYQILERNATKRYGEIDIVALDGKTLVFVEVKTRYSKEYGTPEEAITPWKIRSLVRAANYYIMTHPNLPEDTRMDAVAIEMDGNKPMRVELIKNITL